VWDPYRHPAVRIVADQRPLDGEPSSCRGADPGPSGAFGAGGIRAGGDGAGTRPLSVAEVAAHRKLPLGVARVLVADLVADGQLAASFPGVAQAHDVAFIERLIAGVSRSDLAVSSPANAAPTPPPVAHGSTKTTTTVAMDFGRITIDSSIVLYTFGTPGQDRFGFMWNDLTFGALGGIVLVDTERIADSFVAIDHFENLRLPFVVAVNQFEGRPVLPLPEVRTATNVDPQVPVVAFDARDRESVKSIILNLLDIILQRAKAAQPVRI
jgi:signal recognition particle receptor subunit beta